METLRIFHHPDPTPQVVAYEPTFDRIAYSEVQDKMQLDAYTRRQLETHLGERFNVLLSKTRYEIRQGQIFGENTGEPFMDMLVRGRDYRRLYGNPVDFVREDAEVVGFGKIEKDLTSEDAEIGDMYLSISQPGIKDNAAGKSSIYRHNFYDIFTLQQDDRGRFVQARRYSSALSGQETVDALQNTGVVDAAHESTAEYLLANPIKIKPKNNSFTTADNIHKFLHRDHEYVSEEDMADIIRICTPLNTSYINVLSENPGDVEKQYLILNAIMNIADIGWDAKRAKNDKLVGGLVLYSSFHSPTQEEIYALGAKPVRQVETGCGFSGGFTSPFSTSEFGKINTQETQADKAKKDSNLCRCGGEPHFHCPGKIKNENNKDQPCGSKIMVGKGITQCPKCGEGKKC